MSLSSSTILTNLFSLQSSLKAFAIGAFFLIFSCSGDDPEDIAPIAPDPSPVLTTFQTQAIDYFVDVALGFENGGASEIVRKWTSNDRMRLYISGTTTSALLSEVDNTLLELNELMNPEMSISVVQNQADSNAHLVFGSENDFTSVYPNLASNTSGNWGFFNVWWAPSQEINRAVIWVKTNGTTQNEQISIIKEEITQSLGLGNDSPLYPGSIFYETSTDGGYSTSFSELDREIIRLLYLAEIEVGREESWVRSKLAEIYDRENQD